MRLVIPAFASMILCAAEAAFSQSINPSFDYARSDSDAEDAICADDGLAELDLELNRLYHLALNGPNTAPDRAEELKQSQRDWIRDRHECWTAAPRCCGCMGMRPSSASRVARN